MTGENRNSQRTLRLTLLAFVVLLVLFLFITTASLLLAGPGQGKFGSCSPGSNTKSLKDTLPINVRDRYTRWIYWAGDIHDFPPTRLCRLYAWEGPYSKISGAASIVTTTSNVEAIPSYYKVVAEKWTPTNRWYEIWILLLISIPLAVFLILRMRDQPAENR